LKPIIGNGFGHFSRVTGPWADYIPPSGGAPFANNPYGLGIGTTIQAGADGATITSLTIQPPFAVVGSNVGCWWRFTVVRGPVPPTLTNRAIGNAWQNTLWAINSVYPAIGDSDQESPVLWSKIFFGNNAQNVGCAGGQTQRTHFTFPDFSGPSVGPGEQMTAFITFLQDNLGQGGVVQNYIAMTVCGVYERPKLHRRSGDNIDQTARSIPRGRVGGL
jgi:hypothetical protein